jgi:hypothetical protein
MEWRSLNNFEIILFFILKNIKDFERQPAVSLMKSIVLLLEVPRSGASFHHFEAPVKRSSTVR